MPHTERHTEAKMGRVETHEEQPDRKGGGRTLLSPQRRAQLFTQVDRVTEIPMLVLALFLIPILTARLLLDLTPDTEALLDQLDFYIWVAFTAELVTKTYLAPSRLDYLRAHWLDVLMVLLPIFRPLRVLRFLRIGVVMVRLGVSLRRLLISHGLGYTLLFGGVGVVLRGR